MTGKASDFELDGSEMVQVTQTCVAHFFGGPLNNVRDPGFLWDGAYMNGGAHYNSSYGRWRDPAPDDPDREPILMGCDVYAIKVMKNRDGDRIINCTWEGFIPAGDDR